MRRPVSLRLPVLLLLGTAAGLAACSGIPTAYAVHDLQAIHTAAEGRWEPADRAAMLVPPEDYLEGARGGYVTLGNALQEYPVPDHRAVELAILRQVARVSPERLDTALEAAAWLIVELLADDFPEARVRSVAVLARLAGAWIERAGVRLPAEPPAGDLAAAVRAWEAAVEAETAGRADARQALERALTALDGAAIPDPLVAARLVAGLGRTLDRVRLAVGGREVLERTALRSILAALAVAAGDPDPRVAEASRRNLELLERYARGG